MKHSDIELQDCWIDRDGNHWFCKIVTSETETLQVSIAAMVKYTGDGFRVLTISQFIDQCPSAKLYLRKGRHI